MYLLAAFLTKYFVLNSKGASKIIYWQIDKLTSSNSKIFFVWPIEVKSLKVSRMLFSGQFYKYNCGGCNPIMVTSNVILKSEFVTI